MNFLDIINKCLVELNYKQVNSFAELTKNEHKKIMSILNVLNAEICQYAKWNFLVRKAVLTLPAHTAEIENSINGRISQVLIDSQNFEFHQDAGEILAGKCKGKNLFTTYDSKLLFSKTFDVDKEIEIIYYTYDHVIDDTGMEKDIWEHVSDESLIPKPFCEPILVYGTCMRLKGNQQHVRFNYWVTMYKEALANMVSRCSLDAGFAPVVRLKRS